MKIIHLNLLAGILFMLFILAGCQSSVEGLLPKEERPIPDKLIRTIKVKGMTHRAPVLFRLFKQENILEVWKKKKVGRYDFLKSYKICKWSGKLGPKFREGDRQAPEGFYSITAAQMNPQSDYHLSFNTGYPNSYDRSHGRTGSNLMVHGSCSSAGCYAMTDEHVEEIYALAREAFKGGQKAIQLQIYPFRMTPENMVKHETSPYYRFWEMLKKGNDHFEITKYPPKVDVCQKRYVFNRQAKNGERFRADENCPESTIPSSLERSYLEKIRADKMETARIKANRGWFKKIFGTGEPVKGSSKTDTMNPHTNRIREDHGWTQSRDFPMDSPSPGVPVPYPRLAGPKLMEKP